MLGITQHKKHSAFALVGYSIVAVAFSWPLASHLSDSFLAPPGSDLGVYVWNLWVFRHELIAHHSFPFFTGEILALSPPLPLTLQNYTTFSNLVAFPVLPLAGTVVTFNLLAIGNGILTAYSMFAYARERTGDKAAAWIAGLVFGFCPYMMARSSEHLSLAQAAPLPVFGLILLRLSRNPTRGLSALAGLVVAWAFLCDPYYAVYCLLMLAFTVGYSCVTLDFRPEPLRREWWTTLLDVWMLSMCGLIAATILRGGGRFIFFGIRVSVATLYTPVLVLTGLVLLRLWVAKIRQLAWTLPSWRTVVTRLAPGVAILCIALAPVLYPLLASNSTAFPGPGPVVWRNSSPGLDLVSYLMPNPFHPFLGLVSAAWFDRQPNGATENVASIPWIAIAAMIAATARRRRWAHPGWVAFTVLFALMSLGPFLSVGGWTTFVPGPWALARYLPIVGAARMPTRFAALALLGVAMLTAMALQELRRHLARPRTVTTAIALALAFELLPSPRPLYSAQVPNVYRIIAADSRPVRVLNLPLGLRDGLSSSGNASAESQYHQTTHEKPLVGGYVSRLPVGEVERYRRFPVMSVLLDLSEARAVSRERELAGIAAAHERASRFRIGWIVIDDRKASPELVRFATAAFDPTFVAEDGPWKLYRVSPMPDER